MLARVAPLAFSLTLGHRIRPGNPQPLTWIGLWITLPTCNTYPPSDIYQHHTIDCLYACPTSMSSTKKRKTDNDTSKPPAEQSQSSIPKHVFVVQSLSIENSGDDWEKKVEGIFTNLSKANNVALDIYNDMIIVSKRSHPPGSRRQSRSLQRWKNKALPDLICQVGYTRTKRV